MGDWADEPQWDEFEDWRDDGPNEDPPLYPVGKLAAPDLLDALKEALPVLERAATAEARANLAPTGLPKRTDAADRLARARAAIAKASAQ